MSRRIKTITTIMIIILAFSLFMIFYGYYNNSERNHENNNTDISSLTNNTTNSSGNEQEKPKKNESAPIVESGNIKDKPIPVNSNTVENKKDDIKNKVEDSVPNQTTNKSSTTKEEPKASTKEPNVETTIVDDNKSGEVNITPLPSATITVKKEPTTVSEDVIISSNTETSNQDKQDVLNEIDNALKDLLDAVGKVKTVDESKLDASLESRGDS